MPDAKATLGPSLRSEFHFAEDFVNLNHGSFGATPKSVLEARQKLHLIAEQRPDHFMRYHSIALLDESRAAVAKLLNVPVDEVVFVTNATTGVNTVLRAQTWEDGDVILHFGTIYGACGRTVQYLVDTTPVSCVVIPVIYPTTDAEIIKSFEKAVLETKKAGKKPKLVVFDTVSSMPGIRFPWEMMIVAARENGVLSMIDGAHGVGNIKLDLGANQPDFFVSNCHKWLYAPRPAAVLHVPVRNQHLVSSSIPTSHYYIPKCATQFFSPLKPGLKSNFVLQFEFNGTVDTTPYLCVPTALKFRRDIGGEDAIMDYCQTLAKEGGDQVAKILGTEVMQPDTSGPGAGRCPMVNILLPLVHIPESEVATVYNFFTKELGEQENTFVQVYVHGGKWWLRLSAQVYLGLEDFTWIASIVRRECAIINKKMEALRAEGKTNGLNGSTDPHTADLPSEKEASPESNGSVEKGLGELKVSETQGETLEVKS